MNNLPKHLGGHCNLTHIDEGALDYLVTKYNVETAYDLGCGPGGMVDLMIAKGIDCIGIDGDNTLDPRNKVFIDFTQTKMFPPLHVDLCWSVEFVEHVEEKYIENYLPFLESASIIMMTASPTTKGHHHVNVHECDWWIDKMRSYDFKFLEEDTAEIRSRSTMKRDFIRDTGMVFSYGN